MSSESHQKAVSKEMKRLFTVIRPRRLLMFANIPNISWIDSKYREIMSHFWLYCVERGTAIVFEKDKGICKDRWHLKELEKNLGVVKYFTSIDKLKRIFQKHPNYFDTVHFPRLPSKVYDDYEYYRNARNLAQRAEELSFTSKDMAKIMAYNLLNEWDRIKIDVAKSKRNSITYNILRNEILKDPVSKKVLASETTIRNWVMGIEQFIRSKGKDASVFDNSSI